MKVFRTSVVRSVMVAAALLPVAALGFAQQISTDYDHKVDFSKFHTFSIYKVDATDTLVEGRLREDVTQALTQHGMQAVPQGGDVAVTVIGTVKNEQQYTSFYDGLNGGGFGYGGWRGRFGGGGWGGGETTTSVQQIPVGSLVVDLYDTSTHQLVFRGRASDQLSNNADKNAKKGEKAVDKIFAKLPKNVG